MVIKQFYHCNDNKSLQDTISEPIINPCKIEPEPYIEYKWLTINPSKTAPDYELAKRTIQVCNLNRIKLMRARSEILIELIEFEKQLENWIELVNESDTDRKKMIRLKKLRYSSDSIENHINETEQYSGLCRKFLIKSKPFNKAKEIV